MAPPKRPSARPAHTPGSTFLAYTPNGRRLITVGSNNAIRIFQTGSDGEPVTIEDCSDNNTAVAATNTFFISGAEDGSVSKYSLESNSFEGFLLRTTLAVRDVAISPDGEWVAVASDEIAVKVVNIDDMTRVLTLSDHPRAVKHVTWAPGRKRLLACSCADGRIYVYSLDNEDGPELLNAVGGVIKAVDTNSEASSRAIWHPDGRALGAPTAGREVQVISHSDWANQRSFKDGHNGDLSALSWSPNGALLATSGIEQRMVIWETKTQRPLATYENLTAVVRAIDWHPTENLISYTTQDGDLYIHPNIVPEQSAHLLQDDLHLAPFIHDPLAETSGNRTKLAINGDRRQPQRERRGSVASIDDILGSDAMSEDGGNDADGFVIDDDEAGYAERINGNGKRTNGHLGGLLNDVLKRRSTARWEPEIHEPFQPGSTPWRGNRKYLCANMIGNVWTQDQETHYTATVEFYDQDRRKFHFTDPYRYEKACLTEHGTLFASQMSKTEPATIYYRPHETWTARADWRYSLPKGEDVETIALSDSFVVVTTSKNYVRVYTLFGVPFRVSSQKSTPSVTCAAWRDYVMTIGNGPVGGDGRTKLQYTIENVKRDEVCQSEDIVALSHGADLRGVFFSDTGDPCVYDSAGVLFVLLHWRTTSQARWTPLLDTRTLSRVASGTKTESYWPLGVSLARQQFHCFILKGNEQHPKIPDNIPREFELRIPLGVTLPTPDADDEDAAPKDPEVERSVFEETFVRSSVLHALQSDTLSHTQSTTSQRAALTKAEFDIDKALLQLLNVECRAGEEHGMKALEIVRLLRNANGTMLTAAEKIAGRWGREVLGEKIREEAERREVGLDEGEE